MWEKTKRKGQKKSRLLSKSEEHRAYSQNEEVAKDRTVWTVPSDNLSLGKLLQHIASGEVPGPSLFALAM